MSTKDYFELTYSCTKELWQQHETVTAMVEDMLWGQTFRILPSQEEIIHLNTESIKGNVNTGEEKNQRQWFSVNVPRERFASNSMTSMHIQAWGNVLDYKGIRLESIDHDWVIGMRPKRSEYSRIKSYEKKPLLATVLKPSWSLSIQERIEIACDFVALGGDLIKEDETYIPPTERILQEAIEIQSALDSLHSCKRGLGIYIPNITSILGDRRALDQLANGGVQTGLIAFLLAGMDSIRDFARNNRDWFLWGHRVGYESMHYSLSITAMIQLGYAMGLSAVHVGTPFIRQNASVIITNKAVEEINKLSEKGKDRYIPIFSKTTAEILPTLISLFGSECIMLACGEFRRRGSLNKKLIEAWIEASNV